MKTIAAIPLLGAFATVAWLGFSSRMSHGFAPRQPIEHLAFDPLKKDQDIAFHEGRVKRDPAGAIGWSMLSGAYLARSRECDSYADAVKAEQAARRSLSLRVKGNLGGQTRLVNSLLQQHRFSDALATTENALKIWGREPQLNQLHADILIEIGRYDEARAIASKVPEAFEDPSGKAVRAHLLTILGKPGQALVLLRQAYAVLDENVDATAENLAWFQEKIGETLACMGRFSEAEGAFRQTLALYPRGYKAYANLTRLAARRGDWPSVISYGDKSDAIAPMADILALVGDAYAHQGQSAKAQEKYAQVVALVGRPADGLHEVAPGGHGHTLDRQYAMFCADHNRDLDAAYACAIRDLQARRDIYAFDTLAWVCYRRGELDEAHKAIRKALAWGTQDPVLLDHAAKIDAAMTR